MVQDSVFGQLVRYATKGRVFGQPENQADFEPPWKTENADESDKEKELEADGGLRSDTPTTPAEELASTQADATDVEQQAPIEQQQSRVLQPQRTPDGVTLIDWYRTDDEVNPQNWSSKRKAFAATILNLYTFGVYSSSAIITPAHNEIMDHFNVSYAVASLTLSMYVIGYGIGPLVSWLPSSISPLINHACSSFRHSRKFRCSDATFRTLLLTAYTLFWRYRLRLWIILLVS